MRSMYQNSDDDECMNVSGLSNQLCRMVWPELGRIIFGTHTDFIPTSKEYRDTS